MKQATLIAIMSDTGDERGLQGVRVLRTSNGENAVRDISVDTLRNMLNKHPDAVENVELDCNNELIFTNGACSRYPNPYRYIRMSTLVILNTYQNKQGEGTKIYRLCNYKGQTCILNEDEAVKYLDTYGIANGKIVDKDGKKIISAIKGTYEVQPIESVDSSTKERIANEESSGNSESLLNAKIADALQDVINKLVVNDTDLDLASQGFIEGFTSVLDRNNRGYAIEKLTLKINDRITKVIDVVSFQYFINGKGGDVLEGYFVIDVKSSAHNIKVWGVGISIKNVNEQVFVHAQ